MKHYQMLRNLYARKLNTQPGNVRWFDELTYSQQAQARRQFLFDLAGCVYQVEDGAIIARRRCLNSDPARRDAETGDRFADQDAGRVTQEYLRQLKQAHRW